VSASPNTCNHDRYTVYTPKRTDPKTGAPVVPVVPVAGQGISFWAYGAPGGNTVDVQTLTTADVYSPAKRITVPAGVWTQFFVSWADLGNPANMYRLHFANTVAGAQSTFYIDDVQLTGTTPTVLYDNAVSAGWEDLAWSTTFSKTNTTPARGKLEQVWSYPNIHGDIQATSNQTGTLTAGPITYDPYGTQVVGTTLDNMAGNMDYGWLGQHQRPGEHETGITPVIEMGARIYDPSVGRFLQVDPIEGGTSNDYTYVDDPINQLDLSGEKAGPHQAALCALPWNTLKCKRSALSYKGKATKAGRSVANRGAGVENAVRHAVFAALNAKNNGAGFARALLHAHEQDNDAWLSFGNSGKCSDIARDTRADVKNNEYGVRFGQGFKGSDAQLIAAVTRAVLSATTSRQTGLDFGSPCA
jgi:RHS repeat-associated protein